MYRILIIEDDMGIAEAIQVQARIWNLDAVCVRNFRNVMEEFSSVDPHLVLLAVRPAPRFPLRPHQVRLALLDRGDGG